MSDQLIIFDTTLRDGEQSPGASMTRDESCALPVSWSASEGR
jgi:isopropylmalate/homocitrate/citramalate synthase